MCELKLFQNVLQRAKKEKIIRTLKAHISEMACQNWKCPTPKRFVQKNSFVTVQVVAIKLQMCEKQHYSLHTCLSCTQGFVGLHDNVCWFNGQVLTLQVILHWSMLLGAWPFRTWKKIMTILATGFFYRF